MNLPRGLVAGSCMFFALTGCAGGRVYDNGINHVYLCAVRVVRTNGYQVRQQEFRKKSGKMVAARSVPDPRETVMRRGFFSHVSEVASNAIERGKLEFWDRDLAAVRIRTDKRVVVKFKARHGLLGLGSRRRTKVQFSIDSTDYGREDWVIKRERIKAGGREELYQALARCLEGARGPVLIASADQAENKPEAAPKAASPTPPEKQSMAQAPTEPSKEKAPESPAKPQILASAKPSPKATSSPPPSAQAPPPAAAPAAPIRLTPEELEEKLEQGRKAYEAGKYEKTVQLLEIAIQTDPKNPEALGYLGAANYQLGRHAQAIRMYERYLEIVPGDLRTEDFLDEIRKAQKAKEQAQ